MSACFGLLRHFPFIRNGAEPAHRCRDACLAVILLARIFGDEPNFAQIDQAGGIIEATKNEIDTVRNTHPSRGLRVQHVVSVSSDVGSRM